jgi:hypothetical protein
LIIKSSLGPDPVLDSVNPYTPHCLKGTKPILRSEEEKCFEQICFSSIIVVGFLLKGGEPLQSEEEKEEGRAGGRGRVGWVGRGNIKAWKYKRGPTVFQQQWFLNPSCTLHAAFWRLLAA